MRTKTSNWNATLSFKPCRWSILRWKWKVSLKDMDWLRVRWLNDLYSHWLFFLWLLTVGGAHRQAVRWAGKAETKDFATCREDPAFADGAQTSFCAHSFPLTVSWPLRSSISAIYVGKKKSIHFFLSTSEIKTKTQMLSHRAAFQHFHHLLNRNLGKGSSMWQMC